MQIKIKLTPGELTTLNRVKNRDFEGALASKIIGKFLEWDIVQPSSKGLPFVLTKLGQLALDQNQKKGEKPKDDVYAQCVDFWLKNFHPGFTFGGVQGKAMKSLINKIRTISTNSTDETVVATFQKLCQSLPEWYKTKDLPVLDSKFNDIVAEIQQGPKLKWTPLNSAAHLFFGNE